MKMLLIQSNGAVIIDGRDTFCVVEQSDDRTRIYKTAGHTFGRYMPRHEICLPQTWYDLRQPEQAVPDAPGRADFERDLRSVLNAAKAAGGFAQVAA